MTLKDLIEELERFGIKRAHIREGHLSCSVGMVFWIKIQVRKLPDLETRLQMDHYFFPAGMHVTWWKLPIWKNLIGDKFTFEMCGVEQRPPKHFKCRSIVESKKINSDA